MSAGAFGQWTNARCVADLKGLGGEAGGSGLLGGRTVGGDFVFGGNYEGGNVSGGWGGGWPWEMHAGGTITSGWDRQRGWGY